MVMIRVTCAIIKDNNKVLCAQRSEQMDLPLKWEFPGGKIEDKEHPEDCLRREIKEELDIEIKIIEKLPTNKHFYSDKTIELIPFCCRKIGGEFKLMEHKQIKWIDLKELEILDWAEADIPIVQHLMRQKNDTGNI